MPGVPLLAPQSRLRRHSSRMEGLRSPDSSTATPRTSPPRGEEIDARPPDKASPESPLLPPRVPGASPSSRRRRYDSLSLGALFFHLPLHPLASRDDDDCVAVGGHASEAEALTAAILGEPTDVEEGGEEEGDEPLLEFLPPFERGATTISPVVGGREGGSFAASETGGGGRRGGGRSDAAAAARAFSPSSFDDGAPFSRSGSPKKTDGGLRDAAPSSPSPSSDAEASALAAAAALLAERDEGEDEDDGIIGRGRSGPMETETRGGSEGTTSSSSSGPSSSAAAMTMTSLSSIASSASSAAAGGGRLLSSPMLRRIADKCLSMHSAADSLPPILQLITSNGKLAAGALICVWLGLVALWFPLWLLSFVLTETGVYVAMAGGTFAIGRAIVRLIAFPGSSHRVYGEVESEFSKYSIRMLDLGAGSVADVANAVLHLSSTPSSSSIDARTSKAERILGAASAGGGGASSPAVSPRDLPALWSRAASYRDRVLGVYRDVLDCLVHGDGTADNNGEMSDITDHGNNRIAGDIGDLSGLTDKASEDGRVLAGLLGKVLSSLADLELEAGTLLKGGGTVTRNAAARRGPKEGARAAARAALDGAEELKATLSSLKPPGSEGGGGGGSAEEEDTEGAPNEDGGGDDDASDSSSARRVLQTPSSSDGAMEAVKSTLASLLPMIDPPPHDSIFGLDVLRGCMLSRYKGGRQIWVRDGAGAGGGAGRRRTGGGNGGMVDVLHLPSSSSSSSRRPSGDVVDDRTSPPRGRKAVLYCNPNAGLVEVATGMSLVGGNVSPESGSSGETCWTDFYVENGYDVFLFNYSGFGRSYGARCATEGCRPSSSTTTGGRQRRSGADRFVPGAAGRIVRVLRSIFLDFKPSPATLKSDAITVARHIVNDVGIESLVIHGESIGGMAAAAAARELSSTAQGGGSGGASGKLDLLICDRTFCNLEATAQRLVGAWAGNAIRILTPTWNTDVAQDFLAVNCPKIVANDSADAIIADASSLKSGLAMTKELRKDGDTRRVGWRIETPLEYRMADWEDVGVLESKYAKPTVTRIQAPIWPADKHMSLAEAFHFAACARRVGKVATAAKKKLKDSSTSEGDEEEGMGFEITELSGGGNLVRISGEAVGEGASTSNPSETSSSSSELVEVWKALACTDGLTGSPLGAAVKDGHDGAVSWLCSTVTFGGQMVAESAERRLMLQSKGAGISFGSGVGGGGDFQASPSDFDNRPKNFEEEEDEMHVHPVPIPEVIDALKKHIGSCDKQIKSIEPELRYCLEMLQYIYSRLKSKQVLLESIRTMHLCDQDGSSITSSIPSSTTTPSDCGSFLNLHCGHNNQYSEEERNKLKRFLGMVSSDVV